jgi:hypothetical protein
MPQQAADAYVDFDLHGLVRVRLLSPRPGDEQVIARQLGPLQTTLDGTPDITVRFVDELPVNEPIVYVGWEETGFAGEEFYLLRGRAGARARTLIPFDRVGERVDIVTERGVGVVPHLLALVNLTALSKGVLPLHATAFTYGKHGVLVTGWAKGGKTETLLAFSQLGARYIGDEWIYITPEGDMFGVPEPIRLWRWHVEQLPRVKEGLSRLQRLRLGGLARVSEAAETVAGALPDRNGLASVLRRGAPIIRRQAYTHVTPAELFGGVDPSRSFDLVVLATSHDADTVELDEVKGETVAARMRASLLDEREPLLAHYRQFRYAFPDRRSALIDTAGQIEAELLDSALTGRAAYHLRHPYPFELNSLVAPLEAALSSLPTASGPNEDSSPTSAEGTT